jgi:cell division protein ZapA (FtsZ GTPase activity inhibitor)
MSPKERRAFVRGYRLALRRARKELAEITRRLDAELAELDGKMRVTHEQTVRRIDDEIAELVDTMLSMGNEFRRWQAVEKAIATERDPNELLN